MSEQQVLVTVSGLDHPGITSKLMKVLVKNHATISDMGQAVTHGLLSLSFLLGHDEEFESSGVLKDLLLETKKMKMNLDFQVIESDYVPPKDRERYMVSCVAPDKLPAQFIGEIAELLASHEVNIVRIDNRSNDIKFSSLDILAETHEKLDWIKLKEDLVGISNQHQIDIGLVQDNVFRQNKRLIVFDMDSTLIQTEVIDEMGASFGLGDQIKAITEKAMNGEIDFDNALKERVKLLKGLKKSELDEIAARLPVTEGVQSFIKIVKSLGYKTAIVSGGFRYFAEGLREKLGMDYAFANELEFEGDTLTGKVRGQVVNGAQKAFILELLAQQENISLEQVVAIGDGANDLPMLSKAGLGIAFHAKEKVKKEAKQLMSHGPMTSILYFLGIPGNYQP